MGITGERVRRLFPSWTGLPVWGRVVLAGYAIGFTEGVAAHVRDLLAGGIHAYDAVWAPARTLYYSLVVLDAVAVTLTVRARAAVVPTGVVIMAADLAANWWYNWSAIRADPGSFWAPVGLLPMSLFGVFVVSAGLPLRRLLRSRRSPLAASQIS